MRYLCKYLIRGMIEHIFTYLWNKFKESFFKSEIRPIPQIKRKSFKVSTLNGYNNVMVLCDANDETFTIISVIKKHRIKINYVGYENLIEAIELSVFWPNSNSILIANYPMAYN